LFRGLGLIEWIGFIVVVQNIVSSLVNSRSFDFHEGWLYVLGAEDARSASSRKRKSARYPA